MLRTDTPSRPCSAKSRSAASSRRVRVASLASARLSVLFFMPPLSFNNRSIRLGCSVSPEEIPVKSRYGWTVPAEDKTLTHVEAGSPMGELMRRYWQPACLSEELNDLPR